MPPTMTSIFAVFHTTSKVTWAKNTKIQSPTLFIEIWLFGADLADAKLSLSFVLVIRPVDIFKTIYTKLRKIARILSEKETLVSDNNL